MVMLMVPVCACVCDKGANSGAGWCAVGDGCVGVAAVVCGGGYRYAGRKQR